MTVLDSSGAIDLLLDVGAADAVQALIERDGPVAAPDILVVEVLSVLRRHVRRGALDPERAEAAIADLGDLSMELFGALDLRERAWELRDNLTAADALFVALASRLGEPLATKDRGLAAAARDHARIEVMELG